jgi:SAM-dependent methyltransferase
LSNTLIASETATYESMWLVEDYAKTSPGEQLVPQFMEMSGANPKGDPHWCEKFPIGHKYRDLIRDRDAQTVLDAGCGSGKGAIMLKRAGFRVWLADLTDAGLVDDARMLPFTALSLWEPITQNRFPFRSFDWVYCCDVLEHVPTPFTMLVISRLLEACTRGVFLSIAMQGDNFGVWVGKPLHQTVMNFVQWRECLSALGHVKECRDMLTNGLYLVEPR